MTFAAPLPCVLFFLPIFLRHRGGEGFSDVLCARFIPCLVFSSVTMLTECQHCPSQREDLELPLYFTETEARGATRTSAERR